MFTLFLKHLSGLLDEERPGWREKSVILIDGARWHVSDDARRFYKEQRLPVLVSGPYSYAAAAIE